MKPSPAFARALLRALVGGTALLGIPAVALADNPERANFDVRPEGAGTPPPAVERAGDRLRERLGRFAALSLDDRTGTLRSVGRLNGFLTGPSGRDGADVALDYVRDNATAFGLDGNDLTGLRLRGREFVDGVEHLAWEQRFRGVPTADAGLEAAVTGAGRLVALTGPPAADLAIRSVEPDLGARAAYAAARDSAGAQGAAAISSAGSGAERATLFADGGRASLTLYRGASGYRLAWRVLAPVSSTGVYDVLVDTRTGKVVRRANRVNFADSKVFERSPAHGPQVSFDFTIDPGYSWLTSATAHSGPNAHAFVDEDDTAGFGAGNWNLGSDVAPGPYDLTAANATGCQPLGDEGAPPCTWNPAVARSWDVNRAQSVSQLFYLVNNFHDHLESEDIGFTDGNFEVRTGKPLGNPNVDADPANSDPVLAQALDGADTEGGIPDEDHVNNASFTTLPDGLPGLMEIKLWQSPLFGSYDGANDASLVYHEYTHGLSSRLVTDAQGFGALNTAQAGALGEGWSDFYAMDYLDERFNLDHAPVDVFMGTYLDNRTAPFFRWQGLDCTPTTICTNPSGPANGDGFTYGDFGRIESGGAEVHSDGEIWAQTLWSLRAALIDAYTRDEGIALTRQYVTEGMRLTPPEPSFLDARNAILLASPLSEDDEIIWQVFADRGMGYFAGSDGSEDTTPTADDTDMNEFEGVGTLRGNVTDENGVPLAGATVSIGGFEALGINSDQTGPDGDYAIEDVQTREDRSFPTVRAQKPGYMDDTETGVTVLKDPADTIRDFQLARDFSSSFATPPGSARVDSFTGRDNADHGCGPGGLIDDDPATVWGTDTNNGNGREIVVELAAPIDIGRIAIDPGAGCGDDDTAALRRFEVLVARTPGGAFQSLVDSQFAPDETSRMKDVYASVSGAHDVRYVKLRAKTPQDASDGADGELFIDVAELHVGRTPGSALGIAANTGGASEITTTAATLSGTVRPHPGADEVWFEYGTSPSFSQSIGTGGAIAAGGAIVPVAARITALQPSTRYYVQVVARRGSREYRGGTLSFVTAAVPQLPPPPPPNPDPDPDPDPPVALPRPTLLLDTKLTAKRKGTFKVRTFFGDAAPAGEARFTVLNKRGKRFARALTPVRIGGNVIKTLRLNKRGRKAIRPGKSKRVTLELRLPNGQKLKKSIRLARSKR